MPLDTVAALVRLNDASSTAGARLVLVDRDAFDGRDTAAAAFLAAADVVLYDDKLAAEIAALVPRAALVELVSSGDDSGLTRAAAAVRARKLASEGWRVVWLVSSAVDELALGSSEPGLATANGGADSSAASTPHLLAIGLNGLAG